MAITSNLPCPMDCNCVIYKVLPNASQHYKARLIRNSNAHQGLEKGALKKAFYDRGEN
jgi:hypothetical protein